MVCVGVADVCRQAVCARARACVCVCVRARVAGSRRLCSTLAAAPVLFAHAVVAAVKNHMILYVFSICSHTYACAQRPGLPRHTSERTFFVHARADYSTNIIKSRVREWTGAAARESLRRDRPGGLTHLRFTLAAAPVIFAHAVVTEIEIDRITSPSACHMEKT